MNKHETAKRMYGLDILRSIAIMSVVFGHSMWMIYASVPAGIIDTLFTFCTMIFGFFGVEIFFVLSGFLIGSIFIREFVSVHENGAPIKGAVFIFWIKRWFRTLPNYYLFVGLYLLVSFLLQESDLYAFSWKYLVFVQNFFSSGPGFFYVAWSLAIEEWFYLLLPILFVASLFFSQDRKRSFLVTVFLLFMIPFLLRIGYAVQHPAKGQFSFVYGLTTMYRLDSIAYGVGLSWLWSTIKYRQFLEKHKRTLLLSGLISFAVLLCYLIIFVAKPLQSAGLVLLSYPWATLSITLCFPYMITFVSLKEKSSVRLSVLFVSKISYSLYLLHPLVLSLVDHGIKYYTLQDSKPAGWFAFLLILCSSLFLSWICYRFYEQPFLALREKLIARIKPDKKLIKQDVLNPEAGH